MASTDLRYGYIDAQPVIFNDAQAWSYIAGAWKQIHLADAHNKARLLTKSGYDQLFAGDKLPALPSTAFH